MLCTAMIEYLTMLSTDSWAATGIVSTQIFQRRAYVPSDQDKGKLTNKTNLRFRAGNFPLNSHVESFPL